MPPPGQELADAGGTDPDFALIGGDPEDDATTLDPAGVNVIHTLDDGEEFDQDVTD